VQATQNPIHRVLDLEAQMRQPLAVDYGGTRHRATHRFCSIVVSQDDSMRFRQDIFWEELIY
jgi:hypothetical protein